MTLSKSNHPLLSLIKIQFKNKASMSFKANKAGFIGKIVLYLFLLAGLTTGLYFLFDLFSKRSIFGLFVLPIYYFNFLFIFVFIIILLNCLNSFTDNLYLSPDNQFLVTLPVTSNKLFLSKIIVYYIIELFRSLVILLPLFYSYGIVNNFKLGYYFYCFFILLIVLMIPICLASLLSIFILKIKLWFKNNPIKQNILITLFFLAIFVGVITLFSLIPEEIRLDEKWQTVILPHLKNATLLIEKVFYPISLISMLILGYTNSTQSPYRLSGFSNYTWFLVLILIAFIALCLWLNFIITKKLFIKNIAKSYEHKKETDNLLLTYKKRKLDKDAIYVFDKKNKDLTYNQLIELMDSLFNKEKTLFANQCYNLSSYKKILEKHFKEYKFLIKPISNKPCFSIVNIKKTTHLVLINELKEKKINCYDINAFSKDTKKKPLILGMLFKDFVRSIRYAGSLSSNLIVILAPATITYALNKIYGGFKLTLLGNQLVFAFLMVIELIVLFIYSLKASSIYSKDQKNGYILNIAPINYGVSIFTKLFNLFIVGVLSIALLIFNYQLSTPLDFINYIALFFALLFIYASHLLICAYIDLKSLEKYSFNANTSEKAGLQNEILASLISILVAFAIPVLSFFLARYKASLACIILMMIALLLLIIMLIIFCLYLKKRDFNARRIKK